MKRFIFLCVLLFSGALFAQNIQTYVHPRAVQLLPIIKLEAAQYAPGIREPWAMAAMFDHESCASYRHSECWTTNAELKNSREQGVGLGQLTRAWNPNGTLRFDNLTALRKKYPKELGELDWSTFKTMPNLQIRASLVLLNEEHQRLHNVKGPVNRLRMTRSAYNGGGGRVATARSRCKLTTGCDPQIWYGHVENFLPQSRTPVKAYGNRSPYQINTHYVKDTELRMPKFKPYFEDRLNE